MALTLVGIVALVLVGLAAFVWVAASFSAQPGAIAASARSGSWPSSATAPSSTTAAGDSTPTVAAPAPSNPTTGTYVVVIDAGHQARPNNTQEPIGPGSKTTKPAVASGTKGVVTGNPENVINLAVSLKLRDLLQQQPGVRVVMIRTTPDVDIPNSERARTAGREHADLTIRVHCDGVNDPTIHGLLTMVPSRNQWTGPIYERSLKAGRMVQDATLKTTGAKDRGILKVGYMSGFNWSTVPSVIVEMAVMTNPSDDRLLATADYQDKLARGMADGVVGYLHTVR
jgi:N-acetylmuramoyl-L-alanine amidase